jgi:hypothetical protein
MRVSNIDYIGIAIGQLANGQNAVLVGKSVGAVSERGNGAQVEAAIAVIQFVDGIMGSVGKSILPIATGAGEVAWVGPLVGTVALVHDVSKVADQVSTGQVGVGDLYAVIGDGRLSLGASC